MGSIVRNIQEAQCDGVITDPEEQGPCPSGAGAVTAGEGQTGRKDPSRHCRAPRVEATRWGPRVGVPGSWKAQDTSSLPEAPQELQPCCHLGFSR